LHGLDKLLGPWVTSARDLAEDVDGISQHVVRHVVALRPPVPGDQRREASAMVVGRRQEGVEPVRDVGVAELVVSFSLLRERFTVSFD